MSMSETYRIAHTARCKLHLAADRPDRNLRFILGHAFTLDNLRLQIAQIENSIDTASDTASGSDEDEQISREPSPGVVSFPKSSNQPVTTTRRKTSPPPKKLARSSDSNSPPDEDDGGEEGEDLNLERFGSAAGLPPRMIDDEASGEEDEENELPQPVTPSKEELSDLTKGDGNSELVEMYQKVAGCPCHNQQQPAVENMWDIPQQLEKDTSRLAVMQVAAVDG